MKLTPINSINNWLKAEKLQKYPQMLWQIMLNLFCLNIRNTINVLDSRNLLMDWSFLCFIFRILNLNTSDVYKTYRRGKT